MPTVDLHQRDYRRLALLGRAWNLDVSGAVTRLLDEFEAGAPSAGTPPTFDDQVSVHAVYADQRVDGLFDRRTKRLRITSGPLADRTYRTPSGAAVAVVGLHNRSVNPNRNGWSFWLINETGELLQTLRGPR